MLNSGEETNGYSEVVSRIRDLKPLLFDTYRSAYDNLLCLEGRVLLGDLPIQENKGILPAPLMVVDLENFSTGLPDIVIAVNAKQVMHSIHTDIFGCLVATAREISQACLLLKVEGNLSRYETYENITSRVRAGLQDEAAFLLSLLSTNPDILLSSRQIQLLNATLASNYSVIDDLAMQKSIGIKLSADHRFQRNIHTQHPFRDTQQNGSVHPFRFMEN